MRIKEKREILQKCMIVMGSLVSFHLCSCIDTTCPRQVYLPKDFGKMLTFPILDRSYMSLFLCHVYPPYLGVSLVYITEASSDRGNRYSTMHSILRLVKSSSSVCYERHVPYVVFLWM